MRGNDFLSRTEADQNPEDLRRERRRTGEGVSEVVVVVVVGRKRRVDRQSERGSKREEERGNYRQIEASHGQRGRRQGEEEVATEERETGDRIKECE